MGKQRSSTLGRRARAAIESRQVRQVNPEGLIKSLEYLLTGEPPGDDVMAVLNNLRHLDCIPKSALPLFDKLIKKFPITREPRIRGLD